MIAAVPADSRISSLCSYRAATLIAIRSANDDHAIRQRSEQDIVTLDRHAISVSPVQAREVRPTDEVIPCGSSISSLLLCRIVLFDPLATRMRFRYAAAPHATHPLSCSFHLTDWYRRFASRRTQRSRIAHRGHQCPESTIIGLVGRYVIFPAGSWRRVTCEFSILPGANRVRMLSGKRRERIGYRRVRSEVRSGSMVRRWIRLASERIFSADLGRTVTVRREASLIDLTIGKPLLPVRCEHAVAGSQQQGGN